MRSTILTAALVAMALLPALTVQSQAGEPDLIPREVIFGNPVKSSPQISPDGAHISYLALMIVAYFNIVGITVNKPETNAPLVMDRD